TMRRAMTDIDAACQLLKKIEYRPIDTLDRPANAEVQVALKTVAQKSEFQIFGVCAGSLGEGVTALKDYTQALGYEIPQDLTFDPVEEAVYIKFNPKTGLIYADSYSGDHRGVLVSCQSDHDDGLNEMYGHLPLDLFS
ncbi:MAG: DUF1824 family protein, partial [Elainellaceae cyanobacterium]